MFTYDSIFDFIIQVWKEGGWVMVPLFLLTVFIYYEAMTLLLHLKKTGIRKISRDIWLKWIEDPSKSYGYVGEVISYIVADGYKVDTILDRISQVKQDLIPDVNQKIGTLSVLVVVSPLMGLLGTVIGMLTTFNGLAGSSGQTVDLVADGIRVALITTQTGLMVAIPGYIFISAVIKHRNEYLAFLAQVENQAVQYGALLAKQEEEEEEEEPYAPEAPQPMSWKSGEYGNAADQSEEETDKS